jgi:hypothetical protein
VVPAGQQIGKHRLGQKLLIDDRAGRGNSAEQIQVMAPQGAAQARDQRSKPACLFPRIPRRLAIQAEEA